MATIEKGDRVRVHADGDVVAFEVSVDGGLVVVPTDADRPLFKVALLLREDANEPRGERLERMRLERKAWFYADEVEPTLDKPLVVGNGWRDVCADMIREGKDVDAVAQLVKNSPDVVSYIWLLEALETAFGKLPTADTFRDAWAASPLRGDNPEQSIRAYEGATDAWRGLRKFRESWGK